MRTRRAARAVDIGGSDGGRLGDDADTKLQSQPPSGAVVMHQVQAAYIASGSGEAARCMWAFGGFGASTIEARGDGYNLTNLAQFPGTHAEARYGFALGQTS